MRILWEIGPAHDGGSGVECMSAREAGLKSAFIMPVFVRLTGRPSRLGHPNWRPTVMATGRNFVHDNPLHDWSRRDALSRQHTAGLLRFRERGQEDQA